MTKPKYPSQIRQPYGYAVKVGSNPNVYVDFKDKKDAIAYRDKLRLGVGHLFIIDADLFDYKPHYYVIG